MFIPKKYGQSRIDKCPFCDRQGIILNGQKIPVCQSHKENLVQDMKCTCGSNLEIKNGKFGAFFSCIKCGNMNMKKALDINPIKQMGKANEKPQVKPDEQRNRVETIRSDDPRYFD